jgi:membrane protein DedA with SNARE-associated domain
VYLGYLGAHNHEWLAMWIHRGQAGLWLAIAGAVIVVGILWWRRHKAAERECEAQHKQKSIPPRLRNDERS